MTGPGGRGCPGLPLPPARWPWPSSWPQGGSVIFKLSSKEIFLLQICPCGGLTKGGDYFDGVLGGGKVFEEHLLKLAGLASTLVDS